MRAVVVVSDGGRGGGKSGRVGLCGNKFIYGCGCLGVVEGGGRCGSEGGGDYLIERKQQ